MHPLDGPRLKVKRADEHLEVLDQEIGLFLDSYPSRVTKALDSKHQRYVFKIDLTKDLPLHISAVAGDVLYNLRSSLDQAAFQLAGKEASKDTEFPILKVDIFGGTGSNLKNLRRRFAESTRGFPSAALDVVKELQPYCRGDAAELHPLWLLHELCNIDKHRIILDLSASVTFKNVPNIPGVRYHMVDDYTHVLFVPSTNQEFKPEFTGGIAFGAEPTRVLHGTLWEIRDYIRDSMIPSFVRFFP